MKNKGISSFDANGKLHGEYVSYFDNGSVSIRGNFHHGKRVGYYGCYHKSGETSFRGFYKLNKLVGIHFTHVSFL